MFRAIVAAHSFRHFRCSNHVLQSKMSKRGSKPVVAPPTAVVPAATPVPTQSSETKQIVLFLASSALLTLATAYVFTCETMKYQTKRVAEVAEFGGTQDMRVLDARVFGWSKDNAIELFNAYGRAGVVIYSKLYVEGADILLPFAYGMFGAVVLNALWDPTWGNLWAVMLPGITAAFDLLENGCILALQHAYLSGDVTLSGPVADWCAALAGSLFTPFKYFFLVASGFFIGYAFQRRFVERRAASRGHTA